MRGDYLELNLYLEDLEDDESVDLYVHTRSREMLMFKGVHMNPTRYFGQWSISHDFHGRSATSYIPAEDVWYFTVVHPLDNRADEPAEVHSPAVDNFLVEL